jgi:hypothetical protein
MKYLKLAIAASFSLAACDRISDPVVCPAIVPYSALVTVQDSVTGANVAAGASVILRGTAVVDSVVGQPGVSEIGVGGNRTGTFSLTVRRAGYPVWTKQGVKVEEGPCGARTVGVTARLRPAP